MASVGLSRSEISSFKLVIRRNTVRAPNSLELSNNISCLARYLSIFIDLPGRIPKDRRNADMFKSRNAVEHEALRCCRQYKNRNLSAMALFPSL